MADEIVLYLEENCTAEQIRRWRDAVAQAHISNLTEPTVITGISRDGANMSMSISATSADRIRFLNQCRAALALLSGDPINNTQGVKLDFSTRCLST